LAFDRSSALRIAVLRATNQLQRALIAAALGAPVRIGGIDAGAAAMADEARAVEPNNSNARK
jgi:hypothetical protein